LSGPKTWVTHFSNPDNNGKAAFFNVFGFTAQNWRRLRDELRTHPTARQVVKITPDPHGVRGDVREAAQAVALH
jgi:hypothetical protein